MYTAQVILLLLVASCTFSTPSPITTKVASLSTRPNPAATRTQTPDRETVPLTSTASPVPVGTITATLVPSKTSFPEMPSATADLSGTHTVEKVIESVKPVVIQSSRSPDGKWRAEVLRYDCVRVGVDEQENAYEVIKIIHLKDGVESTLDTQLQYCGGLGAAGLGVEFWAPNSGTLYYTFAKEGVPDGCSGGWWRPLVAYHVASGDRKNLVLGPLSPDRKMLVVPWEKELILWDLDRGETGRLPLLKKDWVVWDVAWSPQGNELVYIQSVGICTPLKSNLVQVNVTRLVQSEIIESVTPAFTSVIYVSPDQIRLSSQNNRKWLVELARSP